jgi:LysR family transcriptional activator of nhaA
MEWLNYHHLLYFWTIVREGTVARAAQHLGLAQPTLSGQIRTLEQTLGEKLFRRAGRRLEPTDVGRMVFRYADEIFALGRELMDTVRDRPTGRPLRLAVGVADFIPKLVAHRLLEPALRMPEAVQIVVREDQPERLLAELAIHELDLVVTDAPPGPGTRVRAYSHLLLETDVALFAAPRQAAGLRRRFPGSLDGAPFLLPAEPAALRRDLERWFERERIRPRVVGEFDDSALLKVFGQKGAGAFASPAVIEHDVRRRYGVRKVGMLHGLRERFYAVTVERRLAHPAVLAISEAAHQSQAIKDSNPD